MKADLAEKESLEAKRAQQEEESRENSKLISEQKAVRSKSLFFIVVLCFYGNSRLNIYILLPLSLLNYNCIFVK